MPTEEKNPTIKIYMLGRFALEYDGEILLEYEGKIHKVWSLLGYLLANHGRTLGTRELPELLCGDERSSDPSKAVKNLVYRLRCVLADCGLPQGEYIVQRGGTYSWNSNLDYTIDTEQFIAAYKQAKYDCDDSDACIARYIQAISIYQGKFLPHAAYDEWAVPTTTYYHRLFTDSILSLYPLLEQKQEYETMLGVCEKAISIDAYDEDIYRIYIQCLAKTGRKQTALAAYETITARLYDEMGVNPSRELKQIYRDIVKSLKGVETDLVAIKEDLNEEGQAVCSYFCDYQIFKDIYRFIARKVNRTGEASFIMLCTLTDSQGRMPEQEQLAEAMEGLKQVLANTLRKGDLFARYSPSQFVLLLSDLSYENGCLVGKRIGLHYEKNKRSKKVKLQYKLQPLDPKDS